MGCLGKIVKELPNWDIGAFNMGEFKDVVEHTEFYIRGKKTSVTSYHRSWVDVGVVRGTPGPTSRWFEFTVRAVAPDKSTRCRSKQGYPMNTGRASSTAGQTRVTRQSCSGLRPDDRIEVDVISVKFDE